MKTKTLNNIALAALIVIMVCYFSNQLVTYKKIIGGGMYTVGVITNSKQQLRGSQYIVYYDYQVNGKDYSQKSVQGYVDFEDKIGEYFYVKFLPQKPNMSLLLSDIPVPTEYLNSSKIIWTEFPHPKKSRYEQKSWLKDPPVSER